MSTRSFIGIQNENNTIDGIYCHFDGYPAGVGRVLKESYTDVCAVRELIAHGDISECLAPDEMTNEIYYDFNAGKPSNFFSLRHFQNAATKCGAEWAYVFSGGQWKTYQLEMK